MSDSGTLHMIISTRMLLNNFYFILCRNSDAPAELKSSFEQCLSGYSEVDMDTREV